MASSRLKRFPAFTSVSNFEAPSASIADSSAWAIIGARMGIRLAPAWVRTVSAAPRSRAACRGWPKPAATQPSPSSKAYSATRSSIRWAIFRASMYEAFACSSSRTIRAVPPRFSNIISRLYRSPASRLIRTPSEAAALTVSMSPWKKPLSARACRTEMRAGKSSRGLLTRVASSSERRADTRSPAMFSAIDAIDSDCDSRLGSPNSRAVATARSRAGRAAVASAFSTARNPRRK